ncbi:MAG: hypothetical protein ACOYW3_12515 [Bacteroidota bacterium]
MGPRVRLLVLMLLFTCSAVAAPPIVIVHQGEFDCRNVSLQREVLPVSGEWAFYPNQLLTPNEIASATPGYREVPSWWNAAVMQPPLRVATYRVTILVSKVDAASKLVLDMPGVYSAYTLWVNGKLLGKNGIVAATESAFVPQWKPDSYVLPSGVEKFDVVIQVANFSHHRSGINETVRIGAAEKLLAKKSYTEIMSTILFFALLLIAIAALVIYQRSTKTRIALVFFACLCVSWALRSVFSNHYLAVQRFPDLDWSLCLRIEYITIYLSTLFGSLVVGILFPKDVGRLARTIYLVICGIFTLFTLVTDPILFTRYVQLYLGFSSILLISILVIVFHAYIENRQGISLLIVSLFLAAVLFGYVILSYEGLFELSPLLFNGGFLVFFVVSGLAVLYRLHKIEEGKADTPLDRLNFR